MVWFIVILAVVVIGIAWLAAQGRLGGMPPLVDDRPGPDLPDTELSGQHLRDLRLAVTARGYSMPQVDALLERLANQLDGVTFQPTDELAAWQNDGNPAEDDEQPAEAETEVAPTEPEPDATPTVPEADATPTVPVVDDAPPEP